MKHEVVIKVKVIFAKIVKIGIIISFYYRLRACLVACILPSLNRIMGGFSVLPHMLLIAVKDG